MKKKQDKIDSLFRDYFAGGSSKIRKSSKPVVGSAMYELSCKCMEFCEDSYGAIREKCPDAARLGAYVDASLNQKEASLLEGHLSVCRKCRDRVREAKAAVEQFEKGVLPEAAQALSPEELARIAKKNPRKK
ncbi:MAG: zf-HC2 domain-containing protein [Candidatus Omnitrophota bacterium]